MPLAHASGYAPHQNPAGTRGFEYVEFTGPDTDQLAKVFTALGFQAVAKHRTKNVLRYQQGDINFILNSESLGHPARFRKAHGPSACAMAFRVEDAHQAFQHAVRHGAKPYRGEKVSPLELQIPAVYGIGGSLLFFVDRFGEGTIYDVDFDPLPGAPDQPKGVGLTHIDHLTHNVYQGHMDQWAGFYERIFNFREIRYFDIRGEKTGLLSRALVSPCGNIRIPINESADPKSQIAEYLREYRGEGIQHIAFTTDDIYHTIDRLKANGVNFLDVPDTYYQDVNQRLPGHGESLRALQGRRILIDGEVAEQGPTLLLQIFTEAMIGPIFFEIIQRKGDEGFGEGNFQALFEAIERDQMQRGVFDE